VSVVRVRTGPTERARVLRRLGCELGQGYLFGRPVAGAHLEPYLIRSADTRASA